MKAIDGQVIKVESILSRDAFYTFEFLGENDMDTYGLVCFTRLNYPNKLVIALMNNDELSIIGVDKGVDLTRKRVSQDTGYDDLIFPKLLRHIEKSKNVDQDFKSFLKSYAASVSVYEDITNEAEEAMQVDTMPIDSFKEMGGVVELSGELFWLDESIVPDN